MIHASDVTAMIPTRGERERLWSKISRGSDQECWPYKGATNAGGYGLLKTARGTQLAHRLVYAAEVGDIPFEQCVLHHCDNPPCCNPAHLWLGTRADNYVDMRLKGREVLPPRNDVSGELNGQAKLTRAQVEEIRARHANGETQAALAIEMGVCNQLVSLIVRRLRWT